MSIYRVTITGADDTVSPSDLASLALDFPFVEWGILASEKRQGSPRFPSLDWVRKLIVTYAGNPMHLSLHLCGRWVRQLALGIPVYLDELSNVLEPFDRVQLNFHDERMPWHPKLMGELMMTHKQMKGRQFIFQVDSLHGTSIFDSVFKMADVVPLFDASGGAGVLPRWWPEAKYKDEGSGRPIAHGYAGGLGPNNLADQIPMILKAAGDAEVWIDMERRVRSDDDTRFDLGKVRSCLEIAAPFVQT